MSGTIKHYQALHKHLKLSGVQKYMLFWFFHKRETFVTVVVCYEGIRVIALILLKTVAGCLIDACLMLQFCADYQVY